MTNFSVGILRLGAYGDASARAPARPMLAEFGIRVNAVAPALTDTPLLPLTSLRTSPRRDPCGRRDYGTMKPMAVDSSRTIADLRGLARLTSDDGGAQGV